MPFNWKTALLSAIYRSVIFFVVTIRHGWRAASMAFLLETGFRFVASGIYGAVLQRLSRVQPPWLSALLSVVLVPALIQVVEYLVHLWAATPNLAAASLVSTLAAAISALFNWFVMRRGALVTGRDAPSLLSDLKRMPILIFDFLAAGPRALWKMLQLT